MPDEKSNTQANTPPKPAHEHVTGAHDTLQKLRERIGDHPELSEAMTELEMALSILTVKTGGML